MALPREITWLPYVNLCGIRSCLTDKMSRELYLDLAKPKSGAGTFFPHVSRAQRLAPARTRTWVVRLGAQCTDHWTTGQSRGVGVPAVQLTTYVKSSTLYGRWYGRTVISPNFFGLMGYYYHFVYALRAPL